MSTGLPILGMAVCLGCLAICVGVGGKLIARWRERHPGSGAADQDE